MANSAMEAGGWGSQTHSGRLPNASKAANDEGRQMAAPGSHTARNLPPTMHVLRRCPREWHRGDSRSRATRREPCPSGGAGMGAVTREHGCDKLPDVLGGGNQ